MIGHVDEYTAGYFDIVIADECHRSIYHAWQGVTHPLRRVPHRPYRQSAGYIERNIFDFYRRDTDKPDFSYPIQAAFKEGYLVPYRFATGISELLFLVLTLRSLAPKGGYAVVVPEGALFSLTKINNDLREKLLPE